MSVTGFNLSGNQVLEHAKMLFSSEDFITSIKLLRECFSDDVSNEDILAYLKADTGIMLDSEGNIDFSPDHIDEDYKEDIKYILSHYELIFENNDKYIVPDDVYRLTTGELSSSLAIFKQLSKYSGAYYQQPTKLINDTAIYEYIKSLNLDKGFYIHKASDDEFLIVGFTENKKAFYDGISQTSKDCKSIVERYLTLNDWI